jgi:hypothetical protein
VVALESALPLLAVAAVSIGAGFAASAMFTTVQLQHTLVAPDAAYYLITAAGIAAAVGGRRRHVPAAAAHHRSQGGQERMTGAAWRLPTSIAVRSH